MLPLGYLKQPHHLFELLLMLCHRAVEYIQRNALTALFYIRELTDGHDSLVFCLTLTFGQSGIRCSVCNKCWCYTNIFPFLLFTLYMLEQMTICPTVYYDQTYRFPVQSC